MVAWFFQTFQNILILLSVIKSFCGDLEKTKVDSRGKNNLREISEEIFEYTDTAPIAASLFSS